MCLPKEFPKPKAKTPSRSPWRRLRQLKPRLSRRIVTSARVNLNEFWDGFEDMDRNRLPLQESAEDNEVNDNILNELMEINQ